MEFFLKLKYGVDVKKLKIDDTSTSTTFCGHLEADVEADCETITKIFGINSYNENEGGQLMDELKIVTGFTKNLVAQLVEKLIKEGCGYDVKINLNDLKATITEEKGNIHLNIDVEVARDDLSKILEEVL